LEVLLTPSLTILNEFDQPKGVFVDLFKILSNKGHFIPIFLDSDSNDFQKMHIVLTFPILTSPDKFTKADFTTQFIEEKVSIFLTQREPYSVNEKLLLPFDDTTWIFFVAFLLYTFMSIIVIKLVSRRFQHMLYETPAFNFVGTLFGISQITLPDANFSRILLMTFILYCLVLRTAYQGLLIEYVSTDIRKSSPTTFEDLHEQGYIVYALDITNARFMDKIPENKR
jgi:hypothetical protein